MEPTHLINFVLQLWNTNNQWSIKMESLECLHMILCQRFLGLWPKLTALPELLEFSGTTSFDYFSLATCWSLQSIYWHSGAIPGLHNEPHGLIGFLLFNGLESFMRDVLGVWSVPLFYLTKPSTMINQTGVMGSGMLGESIWSLVALTKIMTTILQSDWKLQCMQFHDNYRFIVDLTCFLRGGSDQTSLLIWHETIIPFNFPKFPVFFSFFFLQVLI